jgi:hypothetical protein
MRLNATRLGSIASSRNFGDQLDDLAGQVSGLDLNFAQNKSLIDDYSGTTLVTFTRASTGTFLGSNGLIQTATTNEPRFDHNPTTGESLGLLVEEARTNLLLQSNQFNTTWTNSDTSETSAAGIAPDGTNTAWELKDSLDLVPTIHGLTQAVNFVSGTSYTFTCWMKVGTLTQGGFAFPAAAFTTGLSCRVDLLTGSVITSSSGLSTSTTLYANGWVRIISVATATATVASSITIRILNNANSYTGTGNGTILIWGAQLEAGAFPTSYIPTTTATATRAADVASITGSNFSSWYNQTEGTMFAVAAIAGVTGASQIIAQLNNGTESNRMMLLRRADQTASFTVTDGGSAQAEFGTVSISGSTSNAIAATYKTNDFAMVVRGLAAETDSLGTVPAISQLNIGNRIGGTYLNGTIKRLTYWPVRLANTTLQQITQP